MKAPNHYTRLRQAILADRIRTFAEITAFVPVVALSRDLNLDCTEIEERLTDPARFYFREIHQLAALIGMDTVDFALWITHFTSKR